MLAIVNACAVIGLEGCIVEVQTDFNPRAGLPSFTIVGLPDNAVKESRERVRSAIRNSGFDFINKAYVINLSPADLPKSGPAYDLAGAVGVLAATDQVPLTSIDGAVFLGELSLDGSVRHVKGIMPMVYTAQQAGFARAYVPADDAPEAALVAGIEIIPVRSLAELVEHLYGLNPIPAYFAVVDTAEPAIPDGLVDFADVKGQTFSHLKLKFSIRETIPTSQTPSISVEYLHS